MHFLAKVLDHQHQSKQSGDWIHHRFTCAEISELSDGQPVDCLLQKGVISHPGSLVGQIVEFEVKAIHPGRSRPVLLANCFTQLPV